MGKTIQRFFGSVFTKLLAVILLTGLGINLAVGAFFWYFRSEAGREYRQTLAHYLDLVVAEIGTPPDFEKAAALAVHGAFHLRYSASDRNFATRPDMPQALPVKRQRGFWEPQPGVRAVFSRGRIFVELEKVDGKFLFEIGPALADLEIAKPVALLLLLVSLILGGAYFSLRRILKPIARLKEGVIAVGRGNLDHRVPPQPADEFRDLARAFNEMTERIRDMLAARERLMLDVSHELRSPLTRLKVALEFLPDDAVKDSLRQDVLEMEAMTTAILENARIRHGQGNLDLETVDLAQVVRGVLGEFEGRPPGVRIAFMPPVVLCRVNPDLIRTVVRNLMTNAVNNSLPESPAIEVGLESRPPFAVIRIADYGAGIAPENLPRIFEPFFRADPSRSRQSGGYGLGLSLCRTIAETHGGRIEAESAPGRGSTFSVYLPLAT